MIKLFGEDRNIFWFPVKWANSVSRWLMGIRSETGTVKIKNTTDPGAESGCSLDVDVERIYEQIKDRILSDLKKTTEDDTIEEDHKEDGDGDDDAGTGTGTFCAKPVITDGSVTAIQFGTETQLSEGSPAYTLNLSQIGAEMYGAKPITSGNSITGIQFGTAAQLDAGNPASSVSLGAGGNGYWCVPKLTAGNITGIEWAYCNIDDLLANAYTPLGDVDFDDMFEGSVEAIRDDGEIVGISFGSDDSDKYYFGGYGQYGVKATFDNDGVLTRLDFGSDTELSNRTNTKFIETTVGCPYNV